MKDFLPRAAFGAIAATAALSIAACDAGDSALACDLLDTDEISAATGIDLNKGEPLVTSRDDFSGCNWTSTDTGAAVVTLVIVSGRDASQMRADYAESGNGTYDFDAPGAENGYAMLDGIVMGGEVGDYVVEVLVYSGTDVDGPELTSEIFAAAAGAL